MTGQPVDPELPLGEQVAVELGTVTKVPRKASTALATTEPTDIRGLIKTAIEKGHGPEAVQVLERLVALEERMQARNAAADYAQALHEFQSECPPIPRNKKAHIVGRESGVNFEYSYAELPEIANHIRPYLKKVGLSYQWRSEVKGNDITVVCTVRHINGHQESSPCTLPIESKAGMSPQQKVSAARTFGSRLSLIDALGITTADPDLDGAESKDAPHITDRQATDLQALAEEVGIDQTRFFTLLGVFSFKDIKASQYKMAVAQLERRRQRHAKGGAE